MTFRNAGIIQIRLDDDRSIPLITALEQIATDTSLADVGCTAVDHDRITLRRFAIRIRNDGKVDVQDRHIGIRPIANTCDHLHRMTGVDPEFRKAAEQRFAPAEIVVGVRNDNDASHIAPVGAGWSRRCR
ncbi:MAG: hypothetical protein DYH18_06570 [Xanthomonadales bacterium PRO7]|nr:hypothetical protein [Xanthomonadales bacterium PRO7]